MHIFDQVVDLIIILAICMRRKNVKYYMVHIYTTTPITSGNVIHLTSRLDKNRHERTGIIINSCA